MNLYLRYFDREVFVSNADQAIDFLKSIPEISVDADLEADIREYAASDVCYPKRYKVRPRVYFIVIKTAAANMQDFWWRPIVQLVVFGIFPVLISFAYYGKLGRVSFILSLASGILCGAILVIEAEFYATLLIFLCFGAYTIYEIEEAPANV